MVRTAALIMAFLCTAEVSALAAGLFEQVEILDLDGFVERLGHVVNGQRGHGGGGERLHLDAGLARWWRRCDRCARRSASTRHLHVGVREHQRMAQRDQLGGALGGGDAGDARDFERIALGILRAASASTAGERCARKRGRARCGAVAGLAETSTMRGLPAES